MEPKSASLGSSIEVPCVQELAKAPLTTIPHRYVRSDQEPSIKEENTLSHDVPVINLHNLVAGDSNNPELQKLHCACKDWGFFQLTDHGVSSTLINKMKLEIKNLFDLPMEEKKKFWQHPGDTQGFGQLFVVSEEQKLDWGDLFYMVVLPSHARPTFFSNLPCSFRYTHKGTDCTESYPEGTHLQFPELHLSPFLNKEIASKVTPEALILEALVSYSAEVNNIFIKLLNQIEKTLNIKRPEELSGLYEGGPQAMRMNFYPPCPRPDLVMGLTPHSDAGGLTILLQLNEVEGLQIKKNGKWIPVKPLHNAFIVNIGDSLEITTNGIYRSIEHRAVANSEQERLSIATFLIPDMDGILSPAPSLITPETPALFKEIKVVDFYRRFFEKTAWKIKSRLSEAPKGGAWRKLGNYHSRFCGKPKQPPSSGDGPKISFLKKNIQKGDFLFVLSNKGAKGENLRGLRCVTFGPALEIIRCKVNCVNLCPGYFLG